MSFACLPIASRAGRFFCTVLDLTRSDVHGTGDTVRTEWTRARSPGIDLARAVSIAMPADVLVLSLVLSCQPPMNLAEAEGVEPPAVSPATVFGTARPANVHASTENNVARTGGLSFCKWLTLGESHPAAQINNSGARAPS